MHLHSRPIWADMVHYCWTRLDSKQHSFERCRAANILSLCSALGLVPKYFDSLFLGILRRKTFHFEKTAGQSEILERQQRVQVISSLGKPQQATGTLRYMRYLRYLEVP